MFAKVGRPIFGMYLKIGQNGTRVGRYLKKWQKNGTSFMNVPLSNFELKWTTLGFQLLVEGYILNSMLATFRLSKSLTLQEKDPNCRIYILCSVFSSTVPSNRTNWLQSKIWHFSQPFIIFLLLFLRIRIRIRPTPGIYNIVYLGSRNWTNGLF